MPDDEIEVEVEADDKPVVTPEPKPETKDASEGATKGATELAAEAVKSQLKQYEDSLAHERKLRDEERRRAEAAEAAATEARKAKVDSEMDAVENAITALTSEKEVIKGRLRVAMESGDVDATIKANEELSDVITRTAELKASKVYIEQQKTAKSAAPAADPKEAYLSRFAPEAQRYLRDRPQLIDDPRMNKRMIAAHYEAEAEGMVPNSAAYFSFIDEKLGLKTGAEPKPVTTQQTPAAPPRRDSVAAPVSRSEPGAAVIKLTAGEARAATDGTITFTYGPNKGQPIGVKEYARRKAAMQRDGRYNTEGAS